MENRINQVATLATGKKYIILKQAIYQNKNFFFTAEVSPQTEEPTGEIAILEQRKENNKEFLKIVTDKETLKILLKYFGSEE